MTAFTAMVRSLRTRILTLCAFVAAVLCAASGQPARASDSLGGIIPQSQSFIAAPALTMAALPQSHAITSTASPVSGGATRGGGTWEADTWVSLVASPTVGSTFVNWTENGALVSTNSSIGFFATGARALVANFTPVTYSVDVTSVPTAGGTVTGGGTVIHGSAVKLIAVPAAGYEFAGWRETGGLINLSSTLNFTATASRTLTANFVAIVPISGIENFTGATIFAGSTYSGVIVTNGLIQTLPGWGSPYLLPPPSGIAPASLVINASASPSVGGWVAGWGLVYSGGSVTLLATPAPGFTFTNWTENGTVVSIADSYTFTPGAHRTVVANFIASSNADLASLVSDQAVFAQTFDGNLMSYSARVLGSTRYFTLSPTLAQGVATLKINGVAASPGGAMPSVALHLGNNTVNVEVTAADGVSTKTYTLSITSANRPKDLNGDGRSDLIFQNNAGQIGAWYFDTAGNPVLSASISAAGLGDWRIMETADMDGDGFADLIFQNNAGQIAVWYLNGRGIITSSASLCTAGLGDWRIVAATDMNGDATADLIFQNTAGHIAVWYLDGHGAVTSTALLSSASLGPWRLRAIADVNGDGIADFIFQNNYGHIAVWHMNTAGSADSAVLLYGGNLGDWKIAAAVDMNGDGIPDLIFQNNAGQIAVWRMNGNGAAASSAFIYSGGLGDWRVR